MAKHGRELAGGTREQARACLAAPAADESGPADDVPARI